MPGKGKYTTYVSTDNARNTFFKTLFAGSPFSSDWSGDNKDVAKALAAYAYSVLLAGGGTQKGDADHFPAGVDMSFGAGPNIPEDITKDIAGKDLAGAWFPNVISPGPTAPHNLHATGPGDVAINLEPSEKVAGIDVIDPRFVSDDNTLNPADTSKKVAANEATALTTPADLPMGYSVNK